MAPPTWTEVFSGEAASHRADIFGELNGYLYSPPAALEGLHFPQLQR
jgi:hypothetical protein